MLEVEPESSDRRLGDEHADSAVREVHQASLFHVAIVRSANLDGIRNQFPQFVALGIEFAPDDPRFRIPVDPRRAFRDPLRHRPASCVAPFR